MSRSSWDNSHYIVPGLERGLRILEAFTRHETTLSAPELARRLGIPRSTVFRLLTTLEQMGLVERAANGKDYQLGLGVLRLGFECLASKEMIDLGKPILERLRDTVGYSCNLVVRDGRFVVYVARAGVQTPFANNVHLGMRLPAYATLFGRILLRDLSFAQLQALYPEERLHAATDSTPPTVIDLFKQMQLDKAHDYLFEPGYFEPSISTLAAPVYGASRAIVCAIGVTIPTSHVERLDVEALGKATCHAARRLSKLLDHVRPVNDIPVVNKEVFA